MSLDLFCDAHFDPGSDDRLFNQLQSPGPNNLDVYYRMLYTLLNVSAADNTPTDTVFFFFSQKTKWHSTCCGVWSHGFCFQFWIISPTSHLFPFHLKYLFKVLPLQNLCYKHSLFFFNDRSISFDMRFLGKAQTCSVWS